MDLVQFVLVLALVAVVVAVVAAPLRRGRAAPDAEAVDDLAALELAKESKYREIRDAELDRRTGKLSDGDWQALDAQLRAEAMEILRRIDEAGG